MMTGRISGKVMWMKVWIADAPFHARRFVGLARQRRQPGQQQDDHEGHLVPDVDQDDGPERVRGSPSQLTAPMPISPSR